jgi:hypothetical protein
MSVNVKVLIPAKQAEGSLTTQYTASNCRAVIGKFTATNITDFNVTIGVNLVTEAGAPNSTNLVVSNRSIAPGETYTFPELVNQSLEPGGFISTIAGTGAALVIRASGREIT